MEDTSPHVTIMLSEPPSTKSNAHLQNEEYCRVRHSGGQGMQGMPETGGGGLARVPNLRVCKLLVVGVTKTFSETQGGRTGLPARVSGRHVVRG